jgi:predicted phosphoribosyltransferase
MYFESRSQAGAILADQVLEKYRYENCAVVAIGEGGVLIGEQIAVKLHCVLMMLLSEGIEIPGESLSIGAMSQSGQFTYNSQFSDGEINEYTSEFHGYLEIRANVVSGLVPHITNLQKSAEMAKVEAVSVVPSVLAAAQSVLTESQRENGVAVIDFGAATTGIAIYEEGDLQHLAVIPMGGQNYAINILSFIKSLAHQTVDSFHRHQFARLHTMNQFAIMCVTKQLSGTKPTPTMTRR